MLIELYDLDLLYNTILSDYLESKTAVLILTSYNFDALCAAKVLTLLLRADNISYKIQAINGLSEIELAKTEIRECNLIICLNCLGSIDIIEIFHPDKEKKFIVIDSIRPIEVMNIYSDTQIIIINDGSIKDYPDPQEILEEEEMGGGKRKRRNFSESPSKRLKLYNQGKFYGRSCCNMIVELTKSLGRMTIDTLWLNILSTTYQYIYNEITRDSYEYQIQLYNQEAILLNRDNSNITSVDGDRINNDDGSIQYSEEFEMLFLRHWKLFDSIFYSPKISIKLGTWNKKGSDLLKDLLAKAGLPLNDCNQDYAFMTLETKNKFNRNLSEVLEEKGIVDYKIATFTRTYYTSAYTAFDIVYSVMGLLECRIGDTSILDSFNEAYDSLGRSKLSLMGIKKGMKNYQEYMKVLMKISYDLMIKQNIRNSKYFRYIKLANVSEAEIRLFRSPLSLRYLTQYLISLQASRNKWIGENCKPLLLCIQMENKDLMITGETYSDIGEISKNSLSKYFSELSSELSLERIKEDCIIIPQNDFEILLEKLHEIMA